MYLRFAQASAIWPPTDREARRIWSVNEYISSLEKLFDTSKISSANCLANFYTSKSR